MDNHLGLHVCSALCAVFFITGLKVLSVVGSHTVACSTKSVNVFTDWMFSLPLVGLWDVWMKQFALRLEWLMWVTDMGWFLSLFLQANRWIFEIKDVIISMFEVQASLAQAVALYYSTISSWIHLWKYCNGKQVVLSLISKNLLPKYSNTELLKVSFWQDNLTVLIQTRRPWRYVWNLRM